MGDTTVQTGTQPTTTTQGDPAGGQQPNQTQPTPNGTQQGQNQSGKDGDEPLGPGGKKALQAEREARQALEKRLAALAPLEKVAQALAGDNSDGKSEIEQLNEKFAKYEQELAEERKGRLREQVARQYELPDDLANVLKGDTLDELKAHAEVLKKYVPAAKSDTKTRPKPDRSQGGGTGGAADAKSAGLAEARRRFGTKTTPTT